MIVMEYIDGITQKEYLKQRNGALTWKEVVHFATQVLSALDHAHSKGIVHRDVKPQNIMLQADGSIKMMDFGIARFSMAFSVIWRSPTGILGATSASGLGFSLICMMAMETAPVPSNGSLPDSISYIITPTE